MWGLHAWRWINRNSEEDQFSLIPRNGPGHLHDMGYLHGLKNLPKNRRIEFLPYSVGQLKSMPGAVGDPLYKKREFSGDAGLDGKIGLSSDFTMDFTINPDFGQVEADPSVLNLSVYEVFYNEKRPFFLEGSNVYDLEMGEDLLFYSRRIGHSPSYNPDLSEGSYAKMPDATSILGAAKITGRTRNGLSIGIIEGVTGQERVEIATADRKSTQIAEPLTNYAVARIKKEMNDGNTITGVMATSVERRLNEEHLYFLPRSAYTGGMDFRQYFAKKKYNLGIKLVGSTVEGEPEAVQRLQQSSVRYFQRPDADYLDYDSTRTRLSGYGGLVEFGKESYGHWRYHGNLVWKSPGLELNDLGYVTTTDEIGNGLELGYVENEPKGIFREYNVRGGVSNTWNFGRDHLNSHISLSSHMSFANRWQFEMDFHRINESLDTRLLRGGPAVHIKGFLSSSAEIETDPAKKLALHWGVHHHVYDDGVSRLLVLNPGIVYKMTDAVTISTFLNYSQEKEMLHYVSKNQWMDRARYILGELDRKTMGLTVRLDIALTPDLTLQYYGNPYVSVGTYDHFRRVQNTTARSYDQAFHELDATEISYNDVNCTYYIDEPNTSLWPDYSFVNPDFNFREFRSNLVLRWEFKPGSTFYLVWSHARSSHESITSRAMGDNWDKLWDLESQNIIMAKLSYWFAM